MPNLARFLWQFCWTAVLMTVVVVNGDNDDKDNNSTKCPCLYNIPPANETANCYVYGANNLAWHEASSDCLSAYNRSDNVSLPLSRMELWSMCRNPNETNFNMDAWMNFLRTSNSSAAEEVRLQYPQFWIVVNMTVSMNNSSDSDSDTNSSTTDGNMMGNMTVPMNSSSTNSSTTDTTNATDTTTNSTDVTANSTDATTNSTDVTANSTDVTTNSTDTTTNATDVSMNPTETINATTGAMDSMTTGTTGMMTTIMYVSKTQLRDNMTTDAQVFLDCKQNPTFCWDAIKIHFTGYPGEVGVVCAKLHVDVTAALFQQQAALRADMCAAATNAPAVCEPLKSQILAAGTSCSVIGQVAPAGSSPPVCPAKNPPANNNNPPSQATAPTTTTTNALASLLTIAVVSFFVW